MSIQLILDSLIENQRSRYPGYDKSELFEVYCAESILVDYSLSIEQLKEGIVDGPRDGGIDAIYVFVNRTLLTEDCLTDDSYFAEIREVNSIELVIIQTKNTKHFREGPVDKLNASIPLLMREAERRGDSEASFSSNILSAFRYFYQSIARLGPQFPEKIAIQIYYCCKGKSPNDTISRKAASLESTIRGLGEYEAKFVFLGFPELYELSKKQAPITRRLSVFGSPLSGERSYVALCTLQKYIEFISDEGELLTRIFDANVRAYQGEVEVNREIADSLRNPMLGVDFWWLNNGVTIVADKATFTNNEIQHQESTYRQRSSNLI